MRYDLAEIENQIIRTMQANNQLQTIGASIRTHAGDINPTVFYDQSAQEGFIKTLPFIYVQYNGRTKRMADSTKKTVVYTLRFRIYTGAKNLRIKRDAQLSAYDMLSAIYDSLHGKTPKAIDNAGWAIPMLDGDTIQTPVTFLSPFEAPEGENEKLLVNIPNIVVYQSDYSIQVIA